MNRIIRFEQNSAIFEMKKCGIFAKKVFMNSNPLSEVIDPTTQRKLKEICGSER